MSTCRPATLIHTFSTLIHTPCLAQLTGSKRRGCEKEGRLSDALERVKVLEVELRRREEQMAQAEEELRQAKSRWVGGRSMGGRFLIEGKGTRPDQGGRVDPYRHFF